MVPKRRAVLAIKTAIWITCLIPFARLVYRGLVGNLTANPIEFITLSTGRWTLIFLVSCLSITPLRKITGHSWLIRFRRLIGLFAFFYGCLHFLTYVCLDKFFSIDEIMKDIAKRPFITAGFLAFVLLIPLAATSTAAAVRKLGGKNWQRLHRAIYISAIAAVIHFWWKQKADKRDPALFAVILAVLLGIRVIVWMNSRRLERKINSEDENLPTA
jgi:methionine sulfoxide reductase heme-binding subunit